MTIASVIEHVPCAGEPAHSSPAKQAKWILLSSALFSHMGAQRPGGAGAKTENEEQKPAV